MKVEGKKNVVVIRFGSECDCYLVSKVGVDASLDLGNK